MKSINSYVTAKMQLRKTLMMIFSFCCILLICGIFSAIQEDGSSEDDGVRNMENVNAGTVEEPSESVKKSPRELIMEKRARKVRLYIGLALFSLMLLSFLTDIVFIRCPVCSGHIQYGIKPERCSHCGVSFVRKES